MVERSSSALRQRQDFSVASLPSVVANCIQSALEGRQEHEGKTDNDGGDKRAEKELQWADAPVLKVRLQDRLTCGIWRVGDDSQPAPGNGAGDYGEFQFLGKAWNQCGKVGDGRVVIERSQDDRSDHQRPSAQIAQHWRNPPSLASPVDHQCRQKKADQHRTAQVDSVLVALSSHDKGEEKQQSDDH